MTTARFTQKDVAREAGVTQATVSLALSNHPAVAAATRERIKKIAKKLGYQPDPYLAGLAAYRKQQAVAKFQATIAWLSNWHKPVTWQWGGIFNNYFQGASARARELGYHLEEHALRVQGMSPERMERILLARNIQGIILPPQPRPGTTLEFCFDSFSAVTFGYTLTTPQLHTIALHHHRSMEMLVRKLLELGYRRPGLVLSTSEDMRTDRIWSAAFWSEQRALGRDQRVPILTGEKVDAARVLQWFKRHRPDVVVASNIEVYQWLTGSGVAIPEQAGFASLGAVEKDSFLSGIWQNSYETGAKAVDFLINMIHNGERGIPSVRANLLIDAAWSEGSTVRPQSPPLPKGRSPKKMKGGKLMGRAGSPSLRNPP